MRFLYELEPGSMVTFEAVSYELATREYFTACSKGEVVPDGMLPLCVPMLGDKLYWIFADESSTLDEGESDTPFFMLN